MADRPDQKRKGGGWAEFKDGRSVGGTRQRDIAPRLIVAAVAFLAALLFVVQNSNRVEATFLVFEFDARLWVVILLSVLLGAALGQAVGLLRRRRKKE